MKGLWLGIVAIGLGALLFSRFWPIARPGLTNTPLGSAQEYRQGTAAFNALTVKLQIPITLRTQELGLGGKHSLDDAAGMYWDLSSTTQPSFWMKGMRIPLDFVWIANSRIVELTPDVPAPADPQDTTLPIIRPTVFVDGMIEVNQGFVQRNNLRVGDPVVVTIFPSTTGGQ